MKKKIHKYDFLIIGAGLIGSLAAIALHQKKFKVLAVDKKTKKYKDRRTLAVNANSKDFLKEMGIWEKLKSKPKPIEKIIINDYVNPDTLVFENDLEPMGNVVFNSEVLFQAKKICLKKNILVDNFSLDYNNLTTNSVIDINGKRYSFKKIILCVGKNIKNNSVFNNQKNSSDKYQISHVGFFNHSKSHMNVAYENFTDTGPLAVLPSPFKDSFRSTYIYSSKHRISNLDLKKFIKKHFYKSHGKLSFDKNIYRYPITVKINKNISNFILLGDALKSIHPVAGQGWNLGVKDIQTLCNLTDKFSLNDDLINKIYYSRRTVESFIYLSFTSSLTSLYENINPYKKNIIRLGYQALVNLKSLRDLFIKHAMGRSNLID